MMTNTEYVTHLLKACCIKEYNIRDCNGFRSNVWPLRERLEEIVIEIRNDRGPEQYCSPEWLALQDRVGLQSLLGK